MTQFSVTGIENIETIALVQKSASDHPYLARNTVIVTVIVTVILVIVDILVIVVILDIVVTWVISVIWRRES